MLIKFVFVLVLLVAFVAVLHILNKAFKSKKKK